MNRTNVHITASRPRWISQPRKWQLQQTNPVKVGRSGAKTQGSWRNPRHGMNCTLRLVQRTGYRINHIVRIGLIVGKMPTTVERSAFSWDYLLLVTACISNGQSPFRSSSRHKNVDCSVRLEGKLLLSTFI